MRIAARTTAAARGRVAALGVAARQAETGAPATRATQPRGEEEPARGGVLDVRRRRGHRERRRSPRSAAGRRATRARSRVDAGARAKPRRARARPGGAERSRQAGRRPPPRQTPRALCAWRLRRLLPPRPLPPPPRARGARRGGRPRARARRRRRRGGGLARLPLRLEREPARPAPSRGRATARAGASSRANTVHRRATVSFFISTLASLFVASLEISARRRDAAKHASSVLTPRLTATSPRRAHVSSTTFSKTRAVSDGSTYTSGTPANGAASTSASETTPRRWVPTRVPVPVSRNRRLSRCMTRAVIRPSTVVAMMFSAPSGWTSAANGVVANAETIAGGGRAVGDRRRRMYQ